MHSTSLVASYFVLTTSGLLWLLSSEPSVFSTPKRSGEPPSTAELKEWASRATSFLMQSELHQLLLINWCLALYTVLAWATQAIFLGRLTARESSLVTERLIKFCVFKLVLAGALLPPNPHEWGAWLSWFAVAGFMRLFMGMARDRLEGLMAAPGASLSAHLRAVTLVVVILTHDIMAAEALIGALRAAPPGPLASFAAKWGLRAPTGTGSPSLESAAAVQHFMGGTGTSRYTSSRGPSLDSAHLLLCAYDIALIFVEGLKCLVRYGVHLTDLLFTSWATRGALKRKRQAHHATGHEHAPDGEEEEEDSGAGEGSEDGGHEGAEDDGGVNGAGSVFTWEGKGALLYHVELVSDVIVHLMTITHYIHVWYLHGLAFHVVDAILLLDIRSVAGALSKRLHAYWLYREATHRLQHAFPDAWPNNDEPCSICMEPMSRAKQLPCGHTFHLACLRAWVQQGGPHASSFTCPNCRQPMLMENEDGGAAGGGAGGRRGGRMGPVLRAVRWVDAVRISVLCQIGLYILLALRFCVHRMVRNPPHPHDAEVLQDIEQHIMMYQQMITHARATLSSRHPHHRAAAGRQHRRRGGSRGARVPAHLLPEGHAEHVPDYDSSAAATSTGGGAGRRTLSGALQQGLPVAGATTGSEQAAVHQPPHRWVQLQDRREQEQRAREQAAAAAAAQAAASGDEGEGGRNQHYGDGGDDEGERQEQYHTPPGSTAPGTRGGTGAGTGWGSWLGRRRRSPRQHKGSDVPHVAGDLQLQGGDEGLNDHGGVEDHNDDGSDSDPDGDEDVAVAVPQLRTLRNVASRGSPAAAAGVTRSPGSHGRVLRSHVAAVAAGPGNGLSPGGGSLGRLASLRSGRRGPVVPSSTAAAAAGQEELVGPSGPVLESSLATPSRSQQQQQQGGQQGSSRRRGRGSAGARDGGLRRTSAGYASAIRYEQDDADGAQGGLHDYHQQHHQGGAVGAEGGSMGPLFDRDLDHAESDHDSELHDRLGPLLHPWGYHPVVRARLRSLPGYSPEPPSLVGGLAHRVVAHAARTLSSSRAHGTVSHIAVAGRQMEDGEEVTSAPTPAR